MESGSRDNSKEQADNFTEEERKKLESLLGPFDEAKSAGKKNTGRIMPDDDIFTLWGDDFPRLEDIGELFQNGYKKEANRRIKEACPVVRSTDRLKPAAYALLKACAENMMLNELLEKNREKIKKIEERQKKINERMELVIKHLSEIRRKYEEEK